MAEANPEASEVEAGPSPLDLNRPGSSGRNANLLVRNPPIAGDDQGSLQGLLAGMAPPSQIFDGNLPLVDFEADRLQEAMGWVYESVQSLQQQGSAVEAKLSGLQEVLQQLNQAPVDLPAPDVPAVADLSATADADASPTSPSAFTSNTGMRRMLQQLERKRLASEKLIEMRLDSLKCDVDSRLQGKDLQDHRHSLTQKFDSFEARSREDVAKVGSMIHSESAAERRRIQAQLEVVSNRLSTQMELTEKLLKDSLEKSSASDVRLQAVEDMLAGGRLEARLSALEGASKAAAKRTPSLPRSASKEEQGGSRQGSLNVGEEARVAFLEAAVTGLEARIKDLADRDANAAAEAIRAAATAKTGELADTSLLDVTRRLEKLESRLEDSPVAEGSCGGSGEKDDVHRQLVEVHQKHTEMHRQFLEVGVRLQQLEQGGLPSAGGGTDPKIVMELASLATRVNSMENQNGETMARVYEMDQSRTKDHTNNASQIQRVQQDFSTLVRYVTGDKNLGNEDRPRSQTSTSASGEWPLAWLEKRVEALISGKGGMCLESRLINLEKASSASGSSDLGNRVKKLEVEFRGLDIKDLGRVRPDLTEYQRHQEALSRDLSREMKELKVIVGCLEACIPRETRKAVQLFKRAAGSADAVPLSPRDFAVESKILALREEMETQISGATASLESGRDRMTVIVKGLEKKQELLESHLEDVRKNNAPVAQSGNVTRLTTPNGKGVPELPELAELWDAAPDAAPGAVKVPPLRSLDEIDPPSPSQTAQ